MARPAVLNTTPPPDGPPESSENRSVVDMVAEMENQTPPDDGTSPPDDGTPPPDDNLPPPDDDTPPEEGEIDEEALTRELDRRGMVALPAESLAQMFLGQTPPPDSGGDTSPDEDDDTDFQHALITNPKQARQMMADQVMKDVADQQALVNQMVQEVAEAVPELEEADLALVRTKLGASTLSALKEIRSHKSHIGAAKTFAYDKAKMKTPPKKATVPPKAPARPDRTTPPPTAPSPKDEQRNRLAEALSKKTRREVKL